MFNIKHLEQLTVLSETVQAATCFKYFMSWFCGKKVRKVRMLHGCQDDFVCSRKYSKKDETPKEELRHNLVTYFVQEHLWTVTTFETQWEIFYWRKTLAMSNSLSMATCRNLIETHVTSDCWTMDSSGWQEVSIQTLDYLSSLLTLTSGMCILFHMFYMRRLIKADLVIASS